MNFGINIQLIHSTHIQFHTLLFERVYVLESNMVRQRRLFFFFSFFFWRRRQTLKSPEEPFLNSPRCSGNPPAHLLSKQNAQIAKCVKMWDNYLRVVALHDVDFYFVMQYCVLHSSSKTNSFSYFLGPLCLKCLCMPFSQYCTFRDWTIFLLIFIQKEMDLKQAFTQICLNAVVCIWSLFCCYFLGFGSHGPHW